MTDLRTAFAADKVPFGITPTLWWNDDFPLIDIGIPFEQCVSEMALAGFVGCSVGHKYPTDPAVLKPALALRGLRVSEPWVSTYFTIKAMREQTLETVAHQLDFIGAMGGTDLVVAEFGQAVNPLPVAVFPNRPIFTEDQWGALIAGLETAAQMARAKGMRLCYHPHMGTGVNIATDIERLMGSTSAELVQLLLDTGHLAFAGVDPLSIARTYGHRIKHIHLKNIRADIVAKTHAHDWSFQTAIENGVFTVAGDPEGAIDFPPIFQALADAKFEGWLVVEAEQDPAKALPLKYAQMARRYLREILGR